LHGRKRPDNFISVHSRALRISLLAFVAIWFGVVVPLHPRGAIKLGGSCTQIGRAAARRAKRLAGFFAKAGSSDCAICYFVATLDLPPAMGWICQSRGLSNRSNCRCCGLRR